MELIQKLKEANQAIAIIRCEHWNVDLSKSDIDILLACVDGKDEERTIFEALKAAREVQEYLWQEMSLLTAPYDMEIWGQVFYKRVAKILEIQPDNPSAKVELRKRVLQQAALSICALRVLDTQQNDPAQK